MKLKHLLPIVALLTLPLASQAAEPVSVMIVGSFHMSNPGRDLHNTNIDDVLSPKRQGEIARVTAALATFKPTMVATESPTDWATQRYGAYLSGTLAPSRNEVVQLGFRLAKAANLKSVAGIDVEADFPYDKVEAYAQAHGQGEILRAANGEIETKVAKEQTLIDNGSVGATLRFLNDPKRLASDNDFYRLMLRVGGGTDQPGAALLTAWYSRNFQICANLVQLAKPGDRVVVFYGSGHAFLLRQCVSEMPGYKLVEANDYLPK